MLSKIYYLFPILYFYFIVTINRSKTQNYYCERLRLDQGTVSYTYGRLPGSIANFSCIHGHILVLGSTSRLCLANRTWSGTMPLCVQVDCGLPPKIVHGSYQVTTTTMDSIAHYSCQFPYVIMGASSLRCEFPAVWTGEVECILVDCGRPPRVPNGVLVASITTLGSNATLYCAPYHVPNDKTVVMCGSNGRWQGVVGCHYVECSTSFSFPNGNLSIGKIALGSVAPLHCHFPYYLNGNPWFTCTAEGRWEGNGTCEEPICGILPKLERGRIIYTTVHGLLAAQHICNKGKFFRGSRLRICDGSGSWTGTIPECVDIHERCPPVVNISNGYNNVLNRISHLISIYSCRVDYDLRGPRRVVCNSKNGFTWPEEQIPQCILTHYTCSELTLENGRIHVQKLELDKPETVAIHECRRNYTLIGDIMRYCRSNRGSWSGENVKCIYHCGDPERIRGGSYDRTDSLTRYICFTNFYLVGNATRVCQEGVGWSGAPPSCRYTGYSKPMSINTFSFIFILLGNV